VRRTSGGFPLGAKRTTQIVTDGDNDLARYAAELFPGALHTIDVMHVVEKLWDAGSSVHREGTPECHAWVEAQKEALYAGDAADIAAELDRQLALVARTGPGNKYRREKLTEIRGYIHKRLAGMNYRELMTRDLELGSGPVEGAIKNLMYKRMDQGGMRWIKERAEALLQLRCIDANGDWEAFTKFVHDKTRARRPPPGRASDSNNVSPPLYPARTRRKQRDAVRSAPDSRQPLGLDDVARSPELAGLSQRGLVAQPPIARPLTATLREIQRHRRRRSVALIGEIGILGLHLAQDRLQQPDDLDCVHVDSKHGFDSPSPSEPSAKCSRSGRSPTACVLAVRAQARW